MSCQFCRNAKLSHPCPLCSPVAPSWQEVKATLPTRRGSRSKSRTPTPPVPPASVAPKVPACGLPHPSVPGVVCNLNPSHLGDVCMGRGYHWPRVRPAAPANVLTFPPARKDGRPAQPPPEDEKTDPGTPDWEQPSPAPRAPVALVWDKVPASHRSELMATVRSAFILDDWNKGVALACQLAAESRVRERMEVMTAIETRTQARRGATSREDEQKSEALLAEVIAELGHDPRLPWHPPAPPAEVDGAALLADMLADLKAAP